MSNGDCGNYRAYYRYRKDNQYRIDLLKKDIFYQRSVLDIGCNSGLFTLEIANVFSPSSITGIDVDDQLISTAKQHLSKEIVIFKAKQQQHKQRVAVVAASSTSSSYPLFMPRSVAVVKQAAAGALAAASTTGANLVYPFNVSFFYNDLVQRMKVFKD